MTAEQIMRKMKTIKFSLDFNFLANYFFILILFLLLPKGGMEHIQYYDARDYVSLSQSFLNGPHWSILNFPNTYRGYFFPFVLSLFENFFTVNICAVLINTLCLFLLSFFIIPYLSVSLFARPFSRAKSILFSLIFVYFWYGYFYYALTDIIAITLLLLAMVLVNRKSYGCLFLGGMAVAAAFNIRPIYQLNLVLFVLYLVWHIFAQKIRWRGLILFFCGIIPVIAPQVIINHHHNQSYSPFVITDSGRFKGGLYLGQLGYGLKMEKYETYVGDLSKYPTPGVIYTNKDNLYTQYMQSSEQKDFIHYIKFALLNPIKISKVYLIHLFNGLDIKVNTVYIGKIKKLLFMHLISVLNYIVLILGVINLILSFKNTPQGENINTTKLFFYANIFLPLFFVLPVAVEVRFFLPLFILLYLSFLQFTCLSNWQNKKSLLLYLFITGLLVVGACFASNAMSRHLVNNPLYTQISVQP